MLIGELARRARIRAQTIRYYERIGVLPPACRTSAGYRSYGHETLEELRLIKAARAMGFSLQEIARALSILRSGPAPCFPLLQLARRRVEDIEDLTDRLRVQRDRLMSLIETCGPEPCLVELQQLAVASGIGGAES